MGKFRNALARFMAGRYGTNDAFGTFLMIVYLVLLVVSLFVRAWWLNLVILVLIGYELFRMFSRNVAARQKENRWFLGLKGKLSGWWRLKKSRWKYRKTHAFRDCPHCKAVVRLPKKPGEHTVTCPRCKKLFRVKI